MRFMTLIKSNESSKFGPPPPELFHAMASLGAQAAQAGVLVDTAGLLPTAVGTRIRLWRGQMSTSDGPFGAGQDVVGGYAIFNVPSKKEATQWAVRFMELHREYWKGWEGETEVRQMIQPQDSGAGPNRG